FPVDLAGWSLRYFLPEFNGLWCLHAAQHCFAVSDDRLLGQGLRFLQNDECLDCLPPFLVWNSDYSALKDLWHRHYSGLDFTAVYVESAGDYHVLLAVDYIVVAVTVYISDVPRVVPAMSPNLGSRFRHIVIAWSHQRPARHDFAALTGRQNS